MNTNLLIAAALALGTLTHTGPANAQPVVEKTFAVLHVRFSDVTASRFKEADVRLLFEKTASLWSQNTSYGNLTLNFQVGALCDVQGSTSKYVDDGPDYSTAQGMQDLLDDSLPCLTTDVDLSRVSGLIILFADDRPTGFYRGIS